MKVSSLGFVLVVSLMIGACSPAASGSGKSYTTHVRIINKAELSSERLADALYAKSVFVESSKEREWLLRQAVKLAPNDPVYLFRLLPSWTEIVEVGPGSVVDQIDLYDIVDRVAFDEKPEGDKQAALLRREVARQRALLERVLAVDPNYLPALYRYALTKPTPELRFHALEKIAEVDSENAKAFYLIAILRHEIIRHGRKMIDFERQAYQMTRQEWMSVLDALRTGNERPVFRATPARLPSAQDIAVTENGKRLPSKVVEENMRLLLEFGTGEIDELPLGFTALARMRQIARQAYWEAQQLSKHGHSQEAQDSLQVMYRFSEKLAASEPHRMISLLVATAVRNIVRSIDAKIAREAGDKARLTELQKDFTLWKGASKECSALLDKRFAEATSARGDSPPCDYAAEEAGMAAILKKLGLRR